MSLKTELPRLRLTLNVAPGVVAEPQVSNREFLSSFLDLGVWIRIPNAALQLPILASPKSSRIQKASALAGFYQQVGLQAEDAISNLIAWSIWATDRTQNLADLLNRISLRFHAPRQRLDQSYSTAVRSTFLTSNKRRVEVYAVEYLASIARVSDVELPAQFGIPWKRSPSVKAVPREQRKAWEKFPYYMRESLRPLTTNGDQLASCYNKMKHGPQLMFADPVDIALRRGHPRDAAAGFAPTIRLLLAGSRTQETEEEFAASSRVAPFLWNDADNARHWLLQSLGHTANFLFVTGTWIFNFAFPDARRPIGVDDAYVNSLLFQESGHLADYG